MSTDAADLQIGPHDDEPHDGSLGLRLNWLRAGGARRQRRHRVDGGPRGRVSRAPPPTAGAILVAGVAGLVAGAISMAAGEYVSVSTQRDSEQALLAKERRELAEEPEEELAELADIYGRRASARSSPSRWPSELTAHDALARARRGRARHRPRRAHQPVARRLGLDARLHAWAPCCRC